MLRRLLALTLLASTGACATVLGFEEPTDLLVGSDAGRIDEDALTPPGSSSSGNTPVGAPDANPSQLIAVECTCVPGPAAGWSGPFVVAEAFGGEPPTCRGDYTEQAFLGRNDPSAAPAECSCACGGPADVACSVPVASLFTTNTCGTTACTTTSTALGCNDVLECDNGSKKITGATFGASTPSGGSCPPIATVVVPAASWTKSIRLCAPEKTASTCDAGLCQVPPSPLFAAKNRCLSRSGDHACPPAFPVKQTFFGGASDTRSCTACACDAPTGTTCTASPKVLSSGSCRVDATSDAPGACVGFSAGSRLELGPGTPSGGSCTPSGGLATGELVPNDATTVCCLE